MGGGNVESEDATNNKAKNEPSSTAWETKSLYRHSSKTRECHVQVVTGLKDAMDPNLRRRKEFGKRTLEELADSAQVVGPDIQYRLTSIRERSIEQEISYDPNKFGFFHQLGFAGYVRWTYTTSFWRVFLSLTLIFYTLVTFFAILIYAVGVIQPQCLYVGTLDTNFTSAGGYFIDAFAISWTTFSTVVSIDKDRSIDRSINRSLDRWNVTIL
jgi:hypothetical protein